MKCDVCGTKIPLGSSECPNCGYKYKASHVNTYDASGQDHDHIQVKSKVTNFQKNIQSSYKKNYTIPKNRSNVNTQKLAKRMIIIVSIAMIISVLIPLGIAFMTILSDQITDYELGDMTIQEAIDADYDDDGTLSTALFYQEDLVNYVAEELEWEDVRVNEYISNDYYLYASFSINGYKGDGSYTLDVDFSDGDLNRVSLSIYNISDKSIQNSQVLSQEQNTIDLIGTYFQYVGLYDRLVKASQQMVSDGENIWKYNGNDDFIYLTEEYHKNTSSHYYSYYCRIDIVE